MLRGLAILYGLLFVILGIVIFLTDFFSNSEFRRIATLKLLYLIILFVGTGVLGFCAGLCEAKWAKLYFQVFGVIYGLLAILGFYYGSAPIFHVLPNNKITTWVYVTMALTSLIFGFGSKKEVE